MSFEKKWPSTIEATNKLIARSPKALLPENLLRGVINILAEQFSYEEKFPCFGVLVAYAGNLALLSRRHSATVSAFAQAFSKSERLGPTCFSEL